jgi:hypothetical protein
MQQVVLAHGVRILQVLEWRIDPGLKCGAALPGFAEVVTKAALTSSAMTP